MDKYTGFAQESDGDLIVTGTPTVRVTSALTDTLVSIYSSDSLAAPKANPFTLPVNGKIEFHARNGKYRVKLINGATETLIDEVVLNAGVTYGTLAARPAAGLADRLYVATNVGRVYYDNGSAWKEFPDYSLDAMDWFPAADVVAAATTDVFAGIGNFVEVTHASGALAITSLAAAAQEGSPRLVKFTISGGSLSLTHNATSLEILNGGANWTLATGDLALVIGKGSGNVLVIPFRANGLTAADIATQAQQETGTSLLAVVTPGRQHFHPSAAKGWVKFNGTGTVAINASHNVSSITDNGTGDYTINWNTDFSSADYAVACTSGASGNEDKGVAFARTANTPFAAGATRIGTISASTGAAIDADNVCAIAFGDQA